MKAQESCRQTLHLRCAKIEPKRQLQARRSQAVSSACLVRQAAALHAGSLGETVPSVSTVQAGNLNNCTGGRRHTTQDHPPALHGFKTCGLGPGSLQKPDQAAPRCRAGRGRGPRWLPPTRPLPATSGSGSTGQGLAPPL